MIDKNIKKLKETESEVHTKGNDRLKKRTGEALEQYIRRDTSLSTRT